MSQGDWITFGCLIALGLAGGMLLAWIRNR
jgi:hypothetical protein